MRTFFLALLAFFAVAAKAFAVVITEDDTYIYYRMTWNELADDRQRALMKHFDDELCAKVDSLKVPSTWTADAENTLIGNQAQFDSIIAETQTRANNYAASNQNIQLHDLVPTGFIVGLGVSGSGNFAVGIGASALMTLIVVPYEVYRFNKITSDVDDYFELSWALGGLGQGGVGVGGGGGLVVRGAIGIIWGDMPDAGALNGVAVGATGSIAAVQGLGFKVAVVFNSMTNEHNLVAMATVDIGAELEASVEGAVFYFMSQNEIIDFMSSQDEGNNQGTSVVAATDLGLAVIPKPAAQ